MNLTFLCNAGTKQKTIVLAQGHQNKGLKPQMKKKLTDLRDWPRDNCIRNTVLVQHFNSYIGTSLSHFEHLMIYSLCKDITKLNQIM